MFKHNAYLTEESVAIIHQIGAGIRTARLRRNLSQQLVAERAGISKATLGRLEKGDPGVSLAVLANVLTGLDLEQTLAAVANPAEDEVGLALESVSRRQRGGRGARDELDTNF